MNEHPDLDEILLSWCGAGRWRVLGRRLRPLTLMHRELLRMVDSGLVTGAAMSLPELDLAAEICSREAWQAGAWLGRRQTGWRRVLQRLRFALTTLRWWGRLPEQWAAMKDYLQATNNVPEMMVKETTGKPGDRIDAPPLLEVWSVLVEAGYPSREILGEWPAGLAGWLYEIQISRHGGRKFVTESDRVLMEKARAMKTITDPAPRGREEMGSRAAAMREMVAFMREALTRAEGDGDRQSAQSGGEEQGCPD